jgi:hypothetical protein
MRIFLAILFCTIVAERVPSAQMDYDSGNFMLPHCKAALEGASAGPRLNVWAGQCAGVINGLRWIGSSIEGGDKFCPPQRVPPAQEQRVVILYMEQHPEQLHLDFKVLALRALQQAWPCPK